MPTPVRITAAAIGAAAAAVAALTACSSSTSSTSGGSTASGTLASVTIASSAGRLVGPNGHTLYENTVDTSSTISCTGACASEWPPLIGDPVAGAGLNASDFATVARPDGTMQVTFDGHPLYYFDEDTAAGSTKGNGKADEGGSWHPATASAVSTTGGTAPVLPTMTESGAGGGGGY